MNIQNVRVGDKFQTVSYRGKPRGTHVTVEKLNIPCNTIIVKEVAEGRARFRQFNLNHLVVRHA